jgi:hypothetical protein
MRRIMLGLGIVAMLVAAFIVAALVLEPTDPISEEGAARIKEGMTEAEVEEVLGGQKPYRWISISDWNTSVWKGDSGEVAVEFRHDAYAFRVCRPAQFAPKEPPPLIDRLHNRLRRALPW